MTGVEVHLSKLTQAVKRAYPLLEGQDIAEAIWLAQFMDFVSEKPKLETPKTEQKDEPETPKPLENHLPEQPSEPDNPESPTVTDVTSEPDNIPLYAESSKDDGTSQGGQPIRVPGVRMLQDRLLLERALRPLRRQVLSRQYFELDESATIDASAEQNIITPVLKGKAERWLDAHIVIDCGLSMIVWRETLHELTLLFKNSGIYANVHVWYLFTDEEKSYLAESNKTEARHCNPTELINPRKQQLVLMCTDCASSAWFSGSVTKDFLSYWQNKMPVAIIQMLPQRLWLGTALRNSELVNFTSSSPAALNKCLVNNDYWFDEDEHSELIQLPVITIDPISLGALARVLTGNKGQWISGVLIEQETFPIALTKELEQLSAEQRLQRFRQQASPMARKLAEYFSCIPLALPVMRMVQHTMLPESNQAHLAEFLLGGLIKTTQTEDVFIEYEFYPGVGEILMDFLPQSLIREVFFKSIEHMNKHCGQAFDFRAFLQKENNHESTIASINSKSFTQLTSKIFNKLTSGYDLSKKNYSEDRVITLTNSDLLLKEKIKVDQDFIRGDKHTIEKLIINIYGQQASPQFTDQELQEQLAEYRRYIIETYNYLDFKGIDGIAAAVKGSSGVMLEAVYVPLRARMDTPDGESWHRLGGRFYCGTKAVMEADLDKLGQKILPADVSALPIEQWINERQALVVLGDTGSGKSTSMKRLALGLAQCEDAPLPILLPLSAYSKELERHTVSFEDYLPEYFHAKRTQLERNKLQRLFAEALKQQKAFILMDGLDEVGNNRREVVSQVENFVRSWIPDPQSKQKSGNRMVVTSRFVGYRDCPLSDPRWQTVVLNDWSEDEIGRFFKAFTLSAELAWVGGKNNETAHKHAENELQSLLQVIKHNQGIRRLSGNPLLASLLALIKRQGVTLPHRRVELYNLYMGTLLRSWNRSRSMDKQPIGPEIDFSPTQRLLARLALHLRQTNPPGGLIHEEAMRDYLLAYYQEDGYSCKEADEQSKGFLDSVHKYSNLLIEKGHQQYGFIHLTFEEYLAGFGLALEREKTLCGKIPELLQQPEHWKETLLLSLGIMSVVNTDPEKANGILEELLSIGEPGHILFAGEALNDVGASILGNRMTRKVQQGLIYLMRNSEANVHQRAEAGRILNNIGDPRPGVTVKTAHGLPLYRKRGSKQHSIPDIDWQEIPAGTFRMGTEGNEGYSDEKPTHSVSLQRFFISRNPVTNAQYRCFIDAGMYEDEIFWREKLPRIAESWLFGNLFGKEQLINFPEQQKKDYWDWLEQDKNHFQPRFWNEQQWTLDNHPVIGVSWFEALAYSIWINELLDEVTPVKEEKNLRIRLPVEAEWEYAARGNQGFRYAWGDQPDPNLGNYKDTELNRTSAVGIFPASTAFGLHDMSGNIWEWTISRWGEDLSIPDFTHDKWELQDLERNDITKADGKVVRGGSWIITGDQVRCAIRYRNHPSRRDLNIGFRLLCGCNENSGDLQQSRDEREINKAAIKAKQNIRSTLYDAMSGINQLIGLNNVKNLLAARLEELQLQKLRSMDDFSVGHYLFIGNPGTGKTTVARLMGQVFRVLGLLKRGHVVEVKRADLVAGYVGQTVLKTREKIREAFDGILFIDDAHMLQQGHETDFGDFGREAIEALVTDMESERHRLCIIAAGYHAPMQRFIDSNPGLARFTTSIPFEDYSAEELVQIFKLQAQSVRLTLAMGMETALLDVFTYRVQNKDKYFGNGREARKLLGMLQARQNTRILHTLNAEPEKKDDRAFLNELRVEDIPPEYFYKDQQNIRVFLSYSWPAERETGFITALESHCEKHNIELIHSESIKIGESINKYMKNLDTVRHVIVLLDRGYFMSKWCMAELLQIVQRKVEFIYPVIVDGCQLHDVHYRADVMSYWHNTYDEGVRKITTLDISGGQEIGDELNRYRDIYSSINSIFNYLLDKVSLPFDALKSDGFSQLLETIVSNDKHMSSHKNEVERGFFEKVRYQIMKILQRSKEISHSLGRVANGAVLQENIDVIVDALIERASTDIESLLRDELYASIDSVLAEAMEYSEDNRALLRENINRLASDSENLFSWLLLFSVANLYDNEVKNSKFDSSVNYLSVAEVVTARHRQCIPKLHFNKYAQEIMGKNCIIFNLFEMDWNTESNIDKIINLVWNNVFPHDYLSRKASSKDVRLLNAHIKARNARKDIFANNYYLVFPSQDDSPSHQEGFIEKIKEVLPDLPVVELAKKDNDNILKIDQESFESIVHDFLLMFESYLSKVND